MQILAIYGNPKPGGFVHGCVDRAAERLAGRGAEVDRLRLVDAEIRDCTGCFTCLRTGSCPLDGEMPSILDRIRVADGLVVGASVRNGYFPALYKRFYERITYLLGFTRELRGKHVLALGAVGLATGKKHLGRLLTLREFQTHVVGYLFFRTGIPSRLTVDRVSPRLDRAADRLHAAIESQAPLPLTSRLSAAVDDAVMRRLMLKPNPDGVYGHVIEQWRERGLL